MNYPQYICELPFHVSTTHILDVFINCLKNKQYQILEKDQNQIIGIKENVAALKGTLKKLVCIKEKPYEQVCLVKLQLETNQIKCVRIVSVKCITGSQTTNEELLTDFQRSIDKLSHKNLTNLDVYNDASEFVGIVNVSEELENPVNQSPYYLEATAYYMFHKLLSASNYGLGQKVSEQITKIRQNLIQGQSITIKQHINALHQFINQIADNLFQSFNFGKQETSQIMPYCKISIERYCYLKLIDLIMPYYHSQFKEQNEFYQQKLGSFDALQLLELLDLPSVQFVQKQFSKAEDVKCREAIQELNKIEAMTFPKEKIKCLQMMIGILKALNSSQLDQLMKFCLISSKVQNPFSELQLLFDSCNSTDRQFLQTIYV